MIADTIGALSATHSLLPGRNLLAALPESFRRCIITNSYHTFLFKAEESSMTFTSDNEETIKCNQADSLPTIDFFKLFEMRADATFGKLCDVVIIVEGNRFPCHKLVLSCASPVFRAMFTGSMKESDESEVILQGTQTNAWSSVLKYMYTNDYSFITPRNAADVYKVADKFKLETLKTIAPKFMDLGVYLSVAHSYDLPEVKKDIKKQILESFYAYKRFSLEKVPFELLVELVSRDEMNIRSERDVLGAILRWLHANGSRGGSRKKQAEQLFNLVNWENLEVGILRNILNQDLFNYDCDEKIVSSLQSMIGASSTPSYFVDDAIFPPHRRGTKIYTFDLHVPNSGLGHVLQWSSSYHRGFRCSSEEHEDSSVKVCLKLVKRGATRCLEVLFMFPGAELVAHFQNNQEISMQVSGLRSIGAQSFVSSTISLKSSWAKLDESNKEPSICFHSYVQDNVLGDMIRLRDDQQDSVLSLSVFIEPEQV